jgi:hypothetical protein
LLSFLAHSSSVSLARDLAVLESRPLLSRIFASSNHE